MQPDPQDQLNGQRPLWTIGPVTDRPVLGSSGTYVEGKSVTVQFWDGSTETLLYARSEYNDQRIAQDAQNAAMQHVKVKALQGPLIDPAQLTP